MNIQLFVAGGTIDKIYNPLNGDLIFQETCIPDMLERGGFSGNITVETLFLKDSLDMSDRDRKELLERCATSNASKIIISHGTDSMVESGILLGKNITHQTIVLVGAMVPYSIQQSDALFNLGSAITSVQLLPAGVYIVMHGEVFPWHDVMKNKEEGRFQKNKTS